MTSNDRTRLHSFRLRIALLSVVLCGLVLAVFGTSAWVLIRRTDLQRIDHGIQAQGLQYLSVRHRPEHWTQVTNDEMLALDESSQVLLVISDLDDAVYVSRNWPDDLHPQGFPLPGGPDAIDRLRRHRSMGAGAGPHQPPGTAPGSALRPFPRPGRRMPPGAGPRPLPGEQREPRQTDDGLFGVSPDDFAEPSRPPPAGDDGDDAPLLEPDDVWRPERERGMGPGPPGRDPTRRPGSGPRGAPGPMPLRGPEFTTTHASGRAWRIGVMGNPSITLVLGYDLDGFLADMRRVRNAFLVALPAGLVIIAIGAWIVAQRALRPVAALTETVESITAQGLDQRITLEGEDAEFGRLIAVFNQMMDRLQRSFEQAVRFSADAAHELKTPLAVLQGQLEQALHRAPAGSDRQRVFGGLLEQTQRLKSISRKLLLLAQADAGKLSLVTDPLDLADAVRNLAEDAQIMAPQLRVIQNTPEHAWTRADHELLGQVLQNLTTNAIKYCHADGQISLTVQATDDTVRLTIANTGDDMPEADREHLFERFYRTDKARSREVGGAGLGLSLAREIARAHNGELRLDDPQPGLVSFTLSLPLIHT